MKAAEYIEDMFHADDLIALVLISRKEEAKTQQRIWTAKKAASQQVQKWLKYENARGSDIYVSMNPLRPGSRTRCKDDVAEVRRVYVDLDEDGRSKLKELLRDSFVGKIPSASYIVNTSPERYQLIWNVKAGAFTPEEAEALMRGLAAKYGGDRAATDVSRVLRLPGFKHRGKRAWITMSATSEKQTAKKDWPAELFLEPERKIAPLAEGTRIGKPIPSSGGDASPSGRDWAWTKDELRRGAEPEELERKIMVRRQDKRNPADYAKRTVARAKEALGLER